LYFNTTGCPLPRQSINVVQGSDCIILVTGFARIHLLSRQGIRMTNCIILFSTGFTSRNQNCRISYISIGYHWRGYLAVEGDCVTKSPRSTVIAIKMISIKPLRYIRQCSARIPELHWLITPFINSGSVVLLGYQPRLSRELRMEGLQRYQLAALALNSMQVTAGYTKTRMRATVNVLNPPMLY
jgi:hypothetical protein